MVEQFVVSADPVTYGLVASGQPARNVLMMLSVIEFQFNHLPDGGTLHPDLTPAQSQQLRDAAVAYRQQFIDNGQAAL